MATEGRLLFYLRPVDPPCPSCLNVEWPLFWIKDICLSCLLSLGLTWLPLLVAVLHLPFSSSRQAVTCWDILIPSPGLLQSTWASCTSCFFHRHIEEPPVRPVYATTGWGHLEAQARFIHPDASFFTGHGTVPIPNGPWPERAPLWISSYYFPSPFCHPRFLSL